MNKLLNLHGTAASVVVAILATGALLNLAGQGKFGVDVQKFAKYVTNGYGV